MLDTSVIDASVSVTDPIVPVKLLADILTDDQRDRLSTEEGVTAVAVEVVSMLCRETHRDSDIARLLAGLGGSLMRRSAVRESLRILARESAV